MENKIEHGMTMSRNTHVINVNGNTHGANGDPTGRGRFTASSNIFSKNQLSDIKAIQHGCSIGSSSEFSGIRSL